MTSRSRGRPPHPDVLTPTEWRILDAWRHGMTQRVIAERRGISRYGVRYHLRNAAGKLGVASMAELRHWPGFPSTSALATTRSSAMDALKLGPLGQVSMLGLDVAQTEAWYRNVLGLQHVFTFGDLAFFDCDGTRLYIRHVPQEEWRPSSILYFLVPDVMVAHGLLTERGVRFKGAPHMIYSDEATGVEEWMAFFDDPCGNTLAIMARVPPPDALAAESKRPAVAGGP